MWPMRNHGQRVTRRSTLKADRSRALARSAPTGRFRAVFPMDRSAPLRRTWMLVPAPVSPLTVGQGRQTGCGGRAQRGQVDSMRVPSRATNPTRPAAVLQNVRQVRCLFGDDVDRFVQVPVAAGLADPRVAGQHVDVGAVDQPAQHQDRLGPAGRGPLQGRVSKPVAVGLDPAGHAGDGFGGDVEGGTIRQHVAG